MRIALGRRLRFPVFGNVVSRGASGKKGTPPNVNAAPDGPDLCYGKLAEPPSDRGGRAAGEAHRTSLCCPNEEPLCQQAAPPHCCQQHGGAERWDGGAELFGMTKRPSHKHWSGWIQTKSNLDNSIVGITEGGKASFVWCSHIDHPDPSASNLSFIRQQFFFIHPAAPGRSQPLQCFGDPWQNVCLLSKKVVNGALTISRRFKYLYSERAFSSSLNHRPRPSAPGSTNSSLVTVKEH